jgi:hypothetical protein
MVLNPRHYDRWSGAHHAHVCVTAGDSVRLSEALSGQGVVPLAPSGPAGDMTAPKGGRRGR